MWKLYQEPWQLILRQGEYWMLLSEFPCAEYLDACSPEVLNTVSISSESWSWGDSKLPKVLTKQDLLQVRTWEEASQRQRHTSTVLATNQMGQVQSERWKCQHVRSLAHGSPFTAQQNVLLWSIKWALCMEYPVYERSVLWDNPVILWCTLRLPLGLTMHGHQRCLLLVFGFLKKKN